MNFKRFGRTANLWNGTVFKNMMFNGRYESPATTSPRNVIYIPVVGGKTYTFSINSYEAGTTFQSVCSIDEPNPNVSYAIDGQTTFINHGEVNTFTRTIPSTANWLAIQIMSLDNLDNDIMINEGSTALPYQPYKDWHDVPYYIHKTDTDTLTTLPADIYANDTSVTVGLKGQMQQSGTPTPTTPIQPQETGERTGNLWSSNSAWSNSSTDTRSYFRLSIRFYLYDGTILQEDFYNIQSNGYKYFSATPQQNAARMRIKHDGSSFDLIIGDIYDEFIANVPLTLSFILNGYNPTVINGINLSDIMLNTDSTPLPYEPYGYKIPISSASTTTPVYLGEVETTRKVNKLVLDGTENFSNQYGTNLFSLTIQPLGKTNSFNSYCTHYKYNPVQSGLDVNTQNGDFALQLQSTQTLLAFKDVAYSSAADFKAYLAQQYTNGTPVTVWYVLAEPTTGIVNEPLRKIGDYADTVSGITIPTITGADSFDVLTTLKPSEVTVNYKGWHPVADVHERDNGAWD